MELYRATVVLVKRDGLAGEYTGHGITEAEAVNSALLKAIVIGVVEAGDRIHVVEVFRVTQK